MCIRDRAYNSPGLTNWTFVELAIPAAARVSPVQFRWRQLTHSGDCCDQWALDNARVSNSPTPVPPQIVVQPTNQIAGAGATIVLAVGVSGSSPFTFQWRKDGADLVDATNSVCLLYTSPSPR